MEEVYPEEEVVIDPQKECFENKKSGKELAKFVKDFFANKKSLDTKATTAMNVRAFGLKGKPCHSHVKMVQFTFTDPTVTTQNYNLLRSEFSKDENYAIVTKNNMVLLFKRPIDISRRGFLHMIKGLEAGLTR